jgi:hypothetical protein
VLAFASRSPRGAAVPRRVITTLVLPLCVLGCGATLGPVKLLTGGAEECSIRAGSPTSVVGVLIADPQFATAISEDQANPTWPELVGKIVPVIWPSGYTGIRQLSGAIEVLDGTGHRVATTGRRVVLHLQYTAWMGGTNSTGGPEFLACGGRELPAGS